MSDSRRSPIGAGTRALAPSVDPAWVEAFVVEQRLLGVPGQQIGDALVTVEAHLRESGEGVEEAFGEPRAYARRVAPDVPARTAAVLGPRTILHVVLGLAGMLSVTRAFGSWLEEGPVRVTLGDLAVSLVLAALVAGLLARSEDVLRLLVERRWAAMILPFVLVLVLAGLLLVLPQVVLELSTGAVGIAGLAALVVSCVLGWLDAQDDRVVGPGAVPTTGRGTRLGTALLYPALTLLLLVPTWVLHSVA